jgi:hypothetical protein
MTALAEPFDGAAVPAPLLLVQSAQGCVSVAVHDASRLAWQVVVPLPEVHRAAYSFELELEVPTGLFGSLEPWSALQSYGRLDGASEGDASPTRTPEAFRSSVASVSGRLVRARDGFVRHCTLLCSSLTPDEGHARALALWLEAASLELRNARGGLLSASGREGDAPLADEFLSLQLWTVLTDCARSLFETRRALEDRDLPEVPSFDALETSLANALSEEIAYRHRAGFPLAEPVNTIQLERLLGRTRRLKRHFERVLFLDGESYQVENRVAGWFSAIMAMLAYLWFLLWQFELQRHPVAIGSGVVALAMLTAVAYASRERLKEVGRSWLTGRVQRMFAQRVTRYRLPPRERQRSGVVVVSARESFSQSIAPKGSVDHPEYGMSRDVTVLRFVHRGWVRPASVAPAKQVRLLYRLDLSALFPRLHDAVRGFAALDRRTGRVAIVDVARNYEIPVRARLRGEGASEETEYLLVLNKNGLLRIDEA